MNDTVFCISWECPDLIYGEYCFEKPFGTAVLDVELLQAYSGKFIMKML